MTVDATFEIRFKTVQDAERFAEKVKILINPEQGEELREIMITKFVPVGHSVD